MKGDKILNFTEEDLKLLTFEEVQLVKKLSNAEELTSEEVAVLAHIFKKIKNAND